MKLADARPDLVWGVVGPWGHHYPDHAEPGPAIGFQRLALEWWDHWLKSDTPPEPDWPRLRVWLREFDPPADTLPARSGHWIESGPPSQQSEFQTIELNQLDGTPNAFQWLIPADPTIGQWSGDTGYFGRSVGLPLDQTYDDAGSLVFESRPLCEDLILFGSAELVLNGILPDAGGQIAVRLNDLDTTGSVARKCYGTRNLVLDDALDMRPQANSSGPFTVTIPLHTTAYRVRKGHRIRVALSSALWPLVHGHVLSAGIEITGGVLRLPTLRDTPKTLSTPLPEQEDFPKEKTFRVSSDPGLRRWREASPERIEIGWHQPKTKTSFLPTKTSFGYETQMAHELVLCDPVSQVT